MKHALSAVVMILLGVLCAQADPIGALREISGVVGGTGDDSITVGSTRYSLTKDSMLVVNGKRGTIHDVQPGMKASGTAVTTGDRTLNIRMLSVTGEARPTPAPGASVAQADERNAPFVPLRPAPGLVAEAARTPEELANELTGTFWSITHYAEVPSTPAPTPTGSRVRRPANERGLTAVVSEEWFSLNADGTTNCSWTPAVGTWRVLDNKTIEVRLGSKGGYYSITPVITFESGPHYGGMIAEKSVDQRHWLSNVNRIMEKNITAEMRASAPEVIPASTPEPLSPESQATAAELVKANHGNLVFVTGKEGAGSGFIGRIGGASYLITNAHIAAGISDAGFKTLDGQLVSGTAASVAIGRDIFCGTLASKPEKPLEIMSDVDQTARIGDEVVVLGNANGGGVINTIMGRIVGIGPELVEVDAPFLPGNSGSPIIHLKTGKVVGVATYTLTRRYDEVTDKRMPVPPVRHYGSRLDTIKSWQPVNWQAFYAQAAAMEKVHTLTLDLDDVLRDMIENRGHITVDRHNNPVIKDRITQWVQDMKGSHSASDEAAIKANFFSFLKVACQGDVSVARNQFSYDYFQSKFSDEEEMRKGLAKAFGEIAQAVSDSR